MHLSHSFSYRAWSLFCLNYSNQQTIEDMWNLRQKCANNAIWFFCEEQVRCSVDIYYFGAPGARKTIPFNKWGYQRLQQKATSSKESRCPHRLKRGIWHSVVSFLSKYQIFHSFHSVESYLSKIFSWEWSKYEFFKIVC